MRVFSTGDSVSGEIVVCNPPAGVTALVYTFTVTNEGPGPVLFAASVMRPDGSQGPLAFRDSVANETVSFPACVVEGGGGALAVLMQGTVPDGQIFGWYASGVEQAF